MRLLEQYYRINEAAGVAITIGNDGRVDIDICNVVIEQNKLTLTQKITGLAQIEDLTKHLPAKTIIALNISGKGVFEKQVERMDDVDETNFAKILPNANIADFYVQNFISGGRSFISAIRKTEADKWIEQVTSLGFTTLKLSLGPFPVTNIASQLNIYGNELIFNNYHVVRNDQAEWLSVKYVPGTKAAFPLKVESEPIDEKLLIAYATAFQLILIDKIDAVFTGALLENFNKIIEDKKIKVEAGVVLLVFFIALLINFFVFSSLNSSNAKLSEQITTSAQSIDDLQQIEKQVTQKKALLKTIGWESGINKSVFIDQVASLLPKEISLTKAEINPIDLAGSRIQKSVTFLSRKIRISGNCDKVIPVNEWMARIKTRPWVKNIQLDSYTFNSEFNTGQFIISIDY